MFTANDPLVETSTETGCASNFGPTGSAGAGICDSSFRFAITSWAPGVSAICGEDSGVGDGSFEAIGDAAFSGSAATGAFRLARSAERCSHGCAPSAAISMANTAPTAPPIRHLKFGDEKSNQIATASLQRFQAGIRSGATAGESFA